MRAVHLSHDMEAIGRLFSPADALDAARQRRDRTYDPELADLFAAHAGSWFERLGKTEPWDAVLGLEPAPHRTLEDAELDEALTVVADFIDLKSPYMAGHSRRCAQLGVDAARVLGLGDDEVTTLRRAALVHEFGTTAVPNSIWEKPRPAHARRVRPRRASPDAHRADAQTLSSAGRPEPGRCLPPREG